MAAPAKKRVYVHQFQAASSKNLLPLAAAMLVSSARAHPDIDDAYDFDIRIVRENPKDTVDGYRGADVAAFSVYSWNFRQSLAVAALAKQRQPELLVVVGGPQAALDSAHQRMFFESYPYIDIVVNGMGEWAFPDILRARIHNRDFSAIPGVVARDVHQGGAVGAGPPPVYERDLARVPSPFLDGTFDEILEKYPGAFSGALWETNRGCPYRCSFCLQGAGDFSRIIDFPLDRLFQELEWMVRHKISYVFCCDANFGIRARDIAITKKIADLAGRGGYPKVFVVNWLKNSSNRVTRIIDELWKGGLPTRLTLSAQTFNPAALEAIHRRNINLSVFDELKAQCSGKGIRSYTELILGLPMDTYVSIRENIGRCLDRRVSHFFVVYLCRLLNGTEMASAGYREKYALITRPCRIGLSRHEQTSAGVDEYEDVVVSTGTLSVADWRRAHLLACMALALYNFRLAFFVLNFIRQEHGIDVVECLEYIILHRGSSSVISGAVGIVEKGQESIVSGAGTSVVSFEPGERMLYEIHEAVCAALLAEKEVFYRELQGVIAGYMRTRNIDIDSDLCAELFTYQKARVPAFGDGDRTDYEFNYNFPEYFHALCSGGPPAALRKTAQRMSVICSAVRHGNRSDFMRERLTVTSYELNRIRFEPAVTQRPHGAKESLWISD